jgi:hypothetical protein
VLQIVNNAIAGGMNQMNYCIENDATTSGGWSNLTGNKCESTMLGGFYWHGIWTQASFAGNTLSNSMGRDNWNGIWIVGSPGPGQYLGTIGTNVVQCGGAGNNGIYLQGTYADWNITGNVLKGCNFGINANGAGTISGISLGLNLFPGFLTSPVFTYSSGIVIDGGTVNYYQMTDTTGGIGNAGNGSRAYCSNCNSTCTAGSGTGRECFRENGAWTH